MLALLLVLAQAATAPTSLTLAQALDLAAHRNPDLLAAQKGIVTARAGVGAAGQLANPTLALNVGPDAPAVTATIDVRLPIFGQRGSAIDAAQAEVPAAQAQAAAQAVAIRASVRRAYFAQAQAQAQAQLAAETLQIAAQLAAGIRARFNSGGAPLLEAEQAELARKKADLDLRDREALLEVARIALVQLIGAAPEAAFATSTALAVLPQAPSLPLLLARAEQGPEVQALRRREDAAQARARRERAAVRPLPDVSVEAERIDPSTVDTSTPLQHLQTGKLGVRLGLAFDLPILSLNRGRIEQEEAAASEASALARAALLRGQAAVRGARARFEAAKLRAGLADGDFVPAAERVLQMAREGYQLGRAPLVSVLQAQSDLASARGRAVDAAAEAQTAFADLEEAAGGEF